MVIILFLFFNIFLFSSQGIPTAFFCDDFLRGVFVVEGGVQRKIEDGWDGRWDIPYTYPNLSVVPGDLIRFNCYSGSLSVCGSGCFFIYNECHCFDFNTDKPRRSTTSRRIANFTNKICNTEIHALQEYDVAATYVFEHYVPLNASELTCINNHINNTLIALNGKDLNLSLSNYINSSYSIKNVESSITSSNYGYFKLNNTIIERDQIFNISDTLIFNSDIPQKYNITFRNYGKVLEDTKE